MPEHRVGTVIYKRDLSPILTIFRMNPEDGKAFPPSKAGQYIALGRDDCPVTKKTGVGPDGRPARVRPADERGRRPGRGTGWQRGTSAARKLV